MSAWMFRVGDKVVYPNHGVGIIEQISSRGNSGSGQRFYLLKIEASNLRVMVPLDNVDCVGMRPVAKPGDVEHILEYLQRGECHACADWKGRFKENSDKMRTGSLLQVAEVLKCLLQLHRIKPLSFREKKMLDRAVALLVDEVATARAVSTAEALVSLRYSLGKAHLDLPSADTADA
ncbi:MAG: CarD family transcriptional regulator [Terriglobales bacterium]